MKGFAWFACLALAACAAAPVFEVQTTDGPQLQAEVSALDLRATFVPWGQNNGVRTWRSADHISLAFESGVLKSTRGLGADLMSADSEATLAAINGQQRESYTRTFTFLSADNATVFRAFTCQITIQATATIDSTRITGDMRSVTERCANPAGPDITNRFWVDTSGTVWNSRQWLGDRLGYIVVNRRGRA